MKTARGVEGTVSLEAVKEALAKELGPKTTQVLDVGSNHHYSCVCETCLGWWAHVGPEEDEEDVFTYGPFTKERVNEEQRRLGLEVTP